MNKRWLEGENKNEMVVENCHYLPLSGPFLAPKILQISHTNNVVCSHILTIRNGFKYEQTNRYKPVL